MAIDTPTPAQQLEPCPFCDGINTEVREKTMWTGMRSQLINVEVHHWCDIKWGASRGHIELAAPTRDEAIAAWNRRTQNTRALAALEAVEGAIKVDVADNAWIGCVPHHLAGTSVLIIPADAVEVSRG